LVADSLPARALGFWLGSLTTSSELRLFFSNDPARHFGISR